MRFARRSEDFIWLWDLKNKGAVAGSEIGSTEPEAIGTHAAAKGFFFYLQSSCIFLHSVF